MTGNPAWTPGQRPALPLMLGGNVFGWTAGRAASFAVLDRFADAGGTLIDTADYYAAWAPGNSGGESERMIGEWLTATGRRNAMTIATKVGLLKGAAGNGLTPARIVEACDESLRRLQTDVIDIYFAHIDDPATPLEDSLAAFDALVQQGKVRMLGASNFTAERLAEALQIADANGFHRFQMIQPKYNLAVRDSYEGPLEQLALAEGLAVVPFYGLGGGYLTGKYRTAADIMGTPREMWLRPYMEGDGPAILQIMDAIAAETGLSLPDIAMAWVRGKPGILAPIASATSADQMEALIAGTRVGLTADQMQALDSAVPA
ncbi:alcohol dehydrogenase [Sphingobium lactosutens]|uniref:aldo/keto reductase n=1 Tax=Sphingobium lactosutens TaxID=522773 RepID=UPI0015C0BB49|nr:aldo/keto reductase [Sphingobium lactosutens]NWK98724.1 alcohol dehydrogenase [Sphingobium lactosutens]